MKAIEQNIEKEIAQAVMEEQPMQPPAPKRKKRLTESTAAKVIAFLLMLVMTAVTAGGVLGAVFLYSTDVYVTSETAFKQELFSNIAWGDGQTLLNFLIWNSEEQVYQMNTEAADSYCAERNISYVMVPAGSSGTRGLQNMIVRGSSDFPMTGQIRNGPAPALLRTLIPCGLQCRCPLCLFMTTTTPWPTGWRNWPTPSATGSTPSSLLRRCW